MTLYYHFFNNIGEFVESDETVKNYELSFSKACHLFFSLVLLLKGNIFKRYKVAEWNTYIEQDYKGDRSLKNLYNFSLSIM